MEQWDEFRTVKDTHMPEEVEQGQWKTKLIPQPNLKILHSIAAQS